MERLVIALVVVAVVAVVAIVMQRRKPDVPTSGGGYTIPTQLDRNDFIRPDAPWLVAVFTSASCGTCESVVAKATPLDSDIVAVAEVEVGAAADIHKRYGIDAVPTTVVADAEGVVQRSFLGPLTATDLWAAVAELREPGTLPPGGCQSHR